MKKGARVQVRKSSGNVFADLGFDQDEAGHLRIRSALMATLRGTIEKRTSPRPRRQTCSRQPGRASATSSAGRSPCSA